MKLYNTIRDLRASALHPSEQEAWQACLWEEFLPFDLWSGISLHSAEKFNSTVFIHCMGPQSNHKLGAPDHGLLTDVFLRHLLLHLMKRDKKIIELLDHKKWSRKNICPKIESVLFNLCFTQSITAKVFKVH